LQYVNYTTKNSITFFLYQWYPLVCYAAKAWSLSIYLLFPVPAWTTLNGATGTDSHVSSGTIATLCRRIKKALQNAAGSEVINQKIAVLSE